jgi:hypothetical protein
VCCNAITPVTSSASYTLFLYSFLSWLKLSSLSNESTVSKVYQYLFLVDAKSIAEMCAPVWVSLQQCMEITDFINLNPILQTQLKNFISTDCILLFSLFIKSHFHFHKEEHELPALRNINGFSIIIIIVIVIFIITVNFLAI